MGYTYAIGKTLSQLVKSAVLCRKLNKRSLLELGLIILEDVLAGMPIQCPWPCIRLAICIPTRCRLAGRPSEQLQQDSTTTSSIAAVQRCIASAEKWCLSRWLNRPTSRVGSCMCARAFCFLWDRSLSSPVTRRVTTPSSTYARVRCEVTHILYLIWFGLVWFYISTNVRFFSAERTKTRLSKQAKMHVNMSSTNCFQSSSL
jgi:hypothetical protein